ncbi:hypothetical protein GCM10027039_41290 [Terrabacter koreensis]
MRTAGGLPLVLAVLALSACADTTGDTQRAVAKCSLPVESQLGLTSGQSWEKTQVSVEELADGGLRVSAVATVRTAGSGDVSDRPYVCIVAPDASDERGYRVVSVQVQPT